MDIQDLVDIPVIQVYQVIQDLVVTPVIVDRETQVIVDTLV